jgi:hypothetical protein
MLGRKDVTPESVEIDVPHLVGVVLKDDADYVLKRESIFSRH